MTTIERVRCSEPAQRSSARLVSIMQMYPAEKLFKKSKFVEERTYFKIVFDQLQFEYYIFDLVSAVSILH